MKAKIIVDSRNMHGQTKHVLGWGVRPTVDGIVDCFGPYGIDVDEVAVGIALARPRDQIALQTDHASNLVYKAEIESDPRGQVLLGELHLHDGEVEEKIVDVQCALAVALGARDISDGKANYDAIVVCSQDVDLRPALDYALDLGVPIFVAAHDVVQDREHPHILLTPSSLGSLRQTSEIVGHERRSLIACAAVAPDVREWEFVEPWGSGGVWYLHDSAGTPALCHLSDINTQPAPGMKIQLGIKSVSLGKSGRDFPILRVARNPASAPLAEEGVVHRRKKPLRIEVKYQGKVVMFPYDLGGVLPGSRVAVLTHVNPHGQKAQTVLGPIGMPSVSRPGKLMTLSGTPLIVIATGVKIGLSRSQVTSEYGMLALQHLPDEHLVLGDRVAVVFADDGSGKMLPVVFAVSSKLPQM